MRIIILYTFRFLYDNKIKDNGDEHRCGDKTCKTIYIVPVIYFGKYVQS